MKKCNGLVKFYVRKIVEQYINNHKTLESDFKEETNNSKPRSNSLRISVRKLHENYLATYCYSPVSYEKFRKIYLEVCNVSLQHLGAFGPKKKVNSLNLTPNLSSRSLRTILKPLSVHYKNKRVPKIRRSSRITRMQGSMAEDSFVEHVWVSNMESNHISLRSKSVKGFEYPITKLKQSYSAKYSSQSSKVLTNSLNRTDEQTNAKFQAASKEVLEPPTLDQSVFCCKNRNKRKSIKRKDKNKKGHASDRKRKETLENCKQGEDSGVVKHNNHRTKTAQSSKKSCQLYLLKNKSKHPILPFCNCSRKKCINYIPEERRKEIHADFWSLRSCTDRQQWLIKHVEKREPKIKILSLFAQQKNKFKMYFLPAGNGKKKEVCRLFFIHTLGFRWNGVIDAVIKSKAPGPASVRQIQILNKPLHHLPGYIVDSVKQYLKGVWDSISETVPDTQNESCRNYKENSLTGLKVKDLFKDWKMKYKSLKFNLGYHSFRRIFQNMVDLIGSLSGEGPFKDRDNHNSDVGSVAHDVDGESRHLPHTGTLYAGPDTQNCQNCETINSLETTTLDSTTKQDDSCGTEASTTKEFNETSCQHHVGADSKSVSNGDLSIPLIKEDSYCSEQSTSLSQNTDNSLLDDGREYIKPIGSGSSSDCSYTDSLKYRKQRSLSVRNDKSNYPVLPPCKCSKRKCTKKFTEAQRQKINAKFWSLGSYNERKQWILEHIKRAGIKRRVVLNDSQPRKLESRWYYLPDSEDKKVDVCKEFFLRTLGYRWDSVIDTIGKTTPKGEKLAVPDRRGRKPPPHKITEEAVYSMTLYIENFCNGSQSSPQKTLKKGGKPNTGSLTPYGLTVKQLFEDYKSKNPNHKFGYESFRKVFQKVHCAFLESVPQDCSPNEVPSSTCEKSVALVDLEEYSRPAIVECSSSFQTEDTHFLPTREPYSDTSHYPPSPSLPPLSHNQAALPKQVCHSIPEHKNCLYQYNSQLCGDGQLQSPPAIQSSNSGGPLRQAQYSSMGHDPFVKYNHSFHCQSTGVHGHFSQGSDGQGLSSINHHKDNDPIACGALHQYPQYFMPNSEPLHCQMYQYQSILHHFTGSGRFFNYGSFQSQDADFHGGHEKQYHYVPQSNFHRDSINTYNIPKTCHSFTAEPLLSQAHYSIPHFPNNGIQPEINTILSPPQHDNNSICVPSDRTKETKHQDINNSCDFPNRANESNIFFRDKSSSKKKVMADKIKTHKERKIRPKSIRNFRENYPILPPCHCKKKKCSEKFSESDRQRIHDMFWNMKGYNERKQWMLHHIKREDCKRRRIDQFESCRKQESRWYYFPDVDGNLHEVCKDFFLRTLGYKWDSVIDTIKRTTPKGETNTRPDQRGRKAPVHKLSSIVLCSVAQYIQAMQQVSIPVKNSCDVESGQHRKSENICSDDSSQDQTSCMSIPYGLTMKDLFDDYKAKHAEHKIGYESFRRIFRTISRPDKINLNDTLTCTELLIADGQVKPL